jgi:peptidoglycan/xylan/chitin deacetylase (PgdA/CDA1 family)
MFGDLSVAAPDAEPIHAEPRGPTRSPIRGIDFPDGVLALTWDDGPDATTLELARYLRKQRVSGTFFVVGEWIDGVSEEPGVGQNLHATGYRHLPVLGDLVALGHRIGSHTENHALLAGAAAVTVSEQIGESARAIDSILTNELRIFRAPGGAWDRSAAAALTDPSLADLVGPFHWDVDAKDWEGSLYCRSSASECEPGPIPGQTRVRPEVIAHRYVARAEQARHGIVLLHDRVGHVGSHYAVDVAHRLIPELSARGFVFAAPILTFGPLTPRLSMPASTIHDDATFADIDGDGRDDLCRDDSGFVVCARGSTSYDARGIRRASFEAPRRVLRLPDSARAMDVGDVDGDGRADVCVMTDEAIECALARADGTVDALRRWSTELTSARSSVVARSFRLADVDGDGRADACARSTAGILCATSIGLSSFGRARLWLGVGSPRDDSRLELADLDSDGRADLCVDLAPTSTKSGAEGVACALSNGRGFGAISTWSISGDMEGRKAIHLADLNGDDRADLCALTAAGVACALSSGRSFKHSSLWAETRAADIRLADVNGDGRSDLCVTTNAGVDCGLAP